MDAVELQFETHAVRDEAGRGVHNVGDFLQIVLPERRSRLDNIDNALRKPDDGTKLDGAIELDVFHLHAVLVEELLSDMWEFRRHARMRIVCELRPPLRLVHRHHQMTFAKAEVEELVDILARFHEHVLADDADIGRAVLYIRRHISRLRDDEPDLLLLIRDDELARLIGKPFCCIADLGEELCRQGEKLSLRQRHRQIIHIAGLHAVPPGFSFTN